MSETEMRRRLYALGMDPYDFDSARMAVDALAASSGATREQARSIVVSTVETFGLSAP